LVVIRILEAYRMKIDGKSVILVDTLGFDATQRGSAYIMREIVRCMRANFADSVHLAGILYLHDIRKPPMDRGAGRDLWLFVNLVGEASVSNVVVVTNRCETVDSKGVESKLGALTKSLNAWGFMNREAMVESFSGSAGDAHRIVRLVLSNRRQTVLEIQRGLAHRLLKSSGAKPGNTPLQGLSSPPSANPRPPTTLTTGTQVHARHCGKPALKDTDLAVAPSDANIVWNLLARLWERGRRLLGHKRKGRR
jgi:hypothetical protein